MTSNQIKNISLKTTVGGGYYDFWNFKGRYRVCKGSRASKKSKTTALNIIVRMMQYPEANTLVVRKVFRTLKDSCFTELKWAINRLGVSAYWEIKESPLEMTYLPTGQKIYFRGLDDPLKIASITVERGFVCWCWIEEAYEIMNEADFDMLDESIRGAIPEETGLFKQITLTFNPWNEKHWIRKRFFGEITGKDAQGNPTYKFHDIKGYEQKPDGSFLTFFRFILRRSYAMIRHKNRYARLTSMTHHELSLIMKYKKFRDGYAKMNNGRYPNDAECMETLGITEWKLKQLQQHIRESTVQSLSTPVGAVDGDETLEDVIADGVDFAETINDELGKEWANRAIWDAVDCLDSSSAKLLKMRYKEDLMVKDIAERMDASPKGLYFIELNALEKLRTDKTVQEAAEIYGYQMSATGTYNRCIGSKRKWNDSPVEALVLKHLELEDRLSALKKRMVTYET